MIIRFLVFYNKLTQINILITMQNVQNTPEFAIGPATCLNYDGIRENISSIHTIPASPALQQDFPDNLPEVLRSYCISINIPSLFSHQAQALQAIHDLKNIILSTSTSSGKSLVYQLALFQELLHDPDATALLLYPTKALANDQLSPFQDGFNYLKEPGNAAIYDGDTPNSQRIAIRNNSTFLLTNPDMLHISILPHHTAWKRFLSSLRFIIIDEVHVYKGVFGSHFANVIRRLLRIVEFYGGNPLFICTSATIHDPRAFAEKLIERPFTHIHEDGAAHGHRDIVLYNPPMLDEELGVRKGILEEGLNIIARTLQCNLQTLIFARSRRSVELILRRSQGLFPKDSLFGYRSGYLPTERRSIEKGLKSGAYRAVVATNALELGVDIGGMDCVLLLGYPGSIASFLQQIGRAGRKEKDSLAVFVASMDPLDQFILQNPAFILDNSPEQPLINPHNPLILFNQLRCAAYELPINPGDSYGSLSWDELKQYLDVLCIKGDLIEKEQRYFWIGEAYPSAEISIRSISTAPFDLLVEHAGKNNKIGEVDSESVLWMAHPGAIYLQAGESYRVRDLSLPEHKVFLQKGDFDYYTNPKEQQDIEIAEIITRDEQKSRSVYFGNVDVTTQVIGYDRVSWNSNEILQTLPLDLPPSTLNTQAFWMLFSDQTLNILRSNELWFSDPNDYGADWEHIRQHILQRDGHQCSLCGRKPSAGIKLHVHHKKPFRTFDDLTQANQPSNLVTLCEQCHRRVEQSVRIRSGLSGLGYVLSHLAPLYLMCDLRDLGLFIESAWKQVGDLPVIMLYDAFPGGIGLSEHLYHAYTHLLEDACSVIRDCKCAWGCPACVGPVNQEFLNPKQATLALLHEIMK